MIKTCWSDDGASPCRWDRCLSELPAYGGTQLSNEEEWLSARALELEAHLRNSSVVVASAYCSTLPSCPA